MAPPIEQVGRLTVEPISCAFDQLYPGGAGFPEPHLLSESGVAQRADEHGIEMVTELFPAQAYGQPFHPGIFLVRTPDTDAMEPLYRDIAIKAASPVALVRIADAIVYNSLVYVAAHEPRVIYETQRWNDRAATVPPPVEALRNAVPFGPSPATDYLFLASAGSPNYGHVLVDDLPRLKAIDHLRSMRSSRRQGVVMPSFGAEIDQVRRDAVATLCGADVEVRFLSADQTHAIGDLFYASPCSMHPTVKNPLAMNHLRAVARATLRDVAGGAGRLFVGRPPGGSRRLVNENAVVELLTTLGYQQVQPERLSFREQLRLFAGAHHVVGQMGAAMANTLFCAEHSKTLYLAPSGWVEPFYWDLATTLDQRYRVLYGAASTADSSPSHLKDCVIDLDHLARHLDD